MKNELKFGKATDETIKKQPSYENIKHLQTLRILNIQNKIFWTDACLPLQVWMPWVPTQCLEESR